MKSYVKITDKIKSYNKTLEIEGDKSLSIRWALMASQAIGKSKSINILKSEDVLNTLKCLKNLGVKVKLFKNKCEITSKGLNSFNYKKKIVLNAGNSGTLGRLILGILIHSRNKIKIKGDKSLSRRDFSRVIAPLKKFGANFKYRSNHKLPIEVFGTSNAKPIIYYEKKGSAQCKSAVMLAALNTKGQTFIKAKKSRDHTEKLFKFLKIPIKLERKKNFDIIKIEGKKQFSGFNYNIPSDISSSAFFIVLTILSNNSKLIIKNVNINPSRVGVITILKKNGS